MRAQRRTMAEPPCSAFYCLRLGRMLIAGDWRGWKGCAGLEV